jgi:hypothetical protein
VVEEDLEGLLNYSFLQSFLSKFVQTIYTNHPLTWAEAVDNQIAVFHFSLILAFEP